VDIFATGVIIFVIVVGFFPFLESRRTDKDYKLIMDGRMDQYWKEFTVGINLSEDFKNLIS
jgi:hypothetical protein